jgi:hypothetical protein
MSSFVPKKSMIVVDVMGLSMSCFVPNKSTLMIDVKLIEDMFICS